MTTSTQRSSNMSRIRSKNTTPERVVRKELWYRGFRYRLNDKRLPGTPDLVLPKYRAVIFINGCFWHGRRDCPKYVVPKSNTAFWQEKVARNIARDELNAQRLDTLAWTVIPVWECELTKKNLAATVARIEAELIAAKEKYGRYCAIRRQNREFAREQARRAPRTPRPRPSRTHNSIPAHSDQIPKKEMRFKKIQYSPHCRYLNNACGAEID